VLTALFSVRQHILVDLIFHFILVLLCLCRPETLRCDSEPSDATKLLSEIPDVELHCVQ